MQNGIPRGMRGVAVTKLISRRVIFRHIFDIIIQHISCFVKRFFTFRWWGKHQIFPLGFVHFPQVILLEFLLTKMRKKFIIMKV